MVIRKRQIDGKMYRVWGEAPGGQWRNGQKGLLKEYVYNYLKEHPCVDCGETRPVVLEFDHVRGKKIAGIGTLMSRCVDLQVIKDEIDKCEVRCANCHRIKTAKEQNWYSFSPGDERATK